MAEFKFSFVTLHPVKAIKMGMTYKKRIADGLLQRKLAGKGAVLIEGAKWCGKTTTAEQIAQSVKYNMNLLIMARYQFESIEP